MSICKVNECNKKAVGRGLCSKHYQRFMHHGSTEPMEVHDGLRTKYPDEYRSWYAMVRRCTKENQNSYNKYGAKGIELCDRWQGGYGFRNFLEDMGEKPKHGNTDGKLPIYTIDRIDTSKGYYKENCKWSTWREQAAHRSNTGKTPGVYFHSQSGKWRASISRGYKIKCKYFDTKEEALAQREAWEKINPLY